jgi:hypothetical protein
MTATVEHTNVCFERSRIPVANNFILHEETRVYSKHVNIELLLGSSATENCCRTKRKTVFEDILVSGFNLTLTKR